MIKLSRIGAVSVLAVAACVFQSASAATVTISCGTVGQDYEWCKRASNEWAQKTGNTVKLLTIPSSSTDILGLYRRMFSAKSGDVDVVVVDLIWTGMIGQHLIDLKPYSNKQEDSHFPAMIKNNTYDGKLVAMPWFTDAGLLFYRKDLLAKYNLNPPSTWADLAAAAKIIQSGERDSGDKDFQGYVFQAKAYEGLTCDAVEWVDSFGGGTIINSEGEITINNPKSAASLDFVASLIGTVAPKGVLNYAEEDSRGVFQTGKAAFMRNWSYAWSLSQGDDSVIKDKVGVAALPSGPEGKPSATLGGWQLAVSKYSKAQAEAADLVVYLTSEPVQKDRAINGSYNPTYPALYKDADVIKANPFFASLYDVFVNATARPSTVTGFKYNEVSQAFWQAVHNVLSGKQSGAQSVKALESRLTQIKRKGW